MNGQFVGPLQIRGEELTSPALEDTRMFASL